MTDAKRGSLVIKGERVIARLRCGKDDAGKEQRVEQRIPWAHGHDAETIAAANLRVSEIAVLVDMLLEAGRGDLVKKTIEKAAIAATKDDLLLVRRAVQAIVKAKADHARRASITGTTFKEWGESWTSGDLSKKYPDQIPVVDHSLNAQRLAKYIYPHVGGVPLAAFSLNHAQLVMKELPERKTGTRRHIAHLMSRLLHIAVFPAKLVEHHPLPKGFLPKKGKPPLYPYLFPDEERTLLGCADVPIAFRLFVGVLNREGLRISELRDSDWWQWSIDCAPGRATFNLPENKTDEPRMWKISDDTHAAMLLWRDTYGGRVQGSDRAFAALDQVTPEHLAAYHAERKGRGGKEPKALVPRKTEAAFLRDALLTAGVTRRELHTSTETTGRLRAHDLRATFVTYAVRAEKPESWITDRTGHTTITMMKRYQRAARQLAELDFGPLPVLAEALGWVSTRVSAPGSEGKKKASKSGIREDIPRSAKEGGRTPTALRPPEPESAREASASRDMPDLPADPTHWVPQKAHDTQATPVAPNSAGRVAGGGGYDPKLAGAAGAATSSLGLTRLTVHLPDGTTVGTDVDRHDDSCEAAIARLVLGLAQKGITARAVGDCLEGLPPGSKWAADR